MAEQMTHWERVRATLKGQEVDRVAVSMWRHFCRSESSAQELAQAMLSFQHQFDWDFLKVNPRFSYHGEDWGLKVFYDGSENLPKVVETPIHEPNDWSKLEVLKVDHGVLKEHLGSLELIARGLKGQAPFVMTVFTPIAIAAKLAKSREVFLQHLHEHPDKVRYALDVITETFTNFSKACFDRGASGLFYATVDWASTQLLTEEEYRNFARPYDLKLLEVLPPAELNILHVCRNYNLLHTVKDYPVHAFNWDSHGEGNPSFLEGKQMVGEKTVIGGMPLGQELIEVTPQQLTDEALQIPVEMGNKYWILGAGCTYQPATPVANIQAIRQVAQVIKPKQ